MLTAGAILTLIGLGFFYHLSRYFLSERQSRREGVVVTGQVVGAEQRVARRPGNDAFTSGDSPESVTYCYPVVEFQLADGRPWRASTEVNVATPIPPGTPVQIRYLPDQPDRIRLVENSVAWIPKLFLVIGAVLLLGGLVMLGFGAGDL